MKISELLSTLRARIELHQATRKFLAAKKAIEHAEIDALELVRRRARLDRAKEVVRGKRVGRRA